MIFLDGNKVRLTRSELKLLRERNAQQGNSLAPIETAADLCAAVIGGLSYERCAEMLAFMDAATASETAQETHDD